MKQISIEIIQKCPNQCLHCSSLSSIECTLKIETDKVKEVIDAAKILDTQALSISGGEPFEHDGLMSIVEYAKKRNLTVYVYTSGIVSGPDGNVDSLDINLLKKLHDSSVDKLIFDLPAIDETIYDTMMGTKGYQPLVLESIKNSVQVGIFTELHFVPTKINISEIDSVIKFAKEQKVDRVSFIRLILHGRAIKNADRLQLSKAEEENLKIKLRSIMNDSIVRVGIPLQIEGKEHCYAGKGKLCVRYDGRVFGCESFKYKKFTDSEGVQIEPDSVYEKKLEEIYAGSEYLDCEMKFINSRAKGCGYHEKCPIQDYYAKRKEVSMNNSDIKKEVELWMEFYRAFNDDNEFRSINAFDRNRFENAQQIHKDNIEWIQYGISRGLSQDEIIKILPEAKTYMDEYTIMQRTGRI